MTFTVVDTGEIEYSKILIPGQTVEFNLFAVGLFASNLTPAHDQSPSTYIAAQPTFPGYSQIWLDWQGPPVINSGVAERTSIPLVWQRTATGASETIYGYYIYYNAGSQVIAAERFGSPIVITDVGDKIEFSLKMSVANGS